MKPILIDALHINMSGALMILNHLVNKLTERKVDFVLLRDERCPKLDSEDKVAEVHVMSCATKVRALFYKAHRDDYSCVLCLGNVPPTIRLKCPTYTYIHNVSLLKLPSDYSLKKRFKTWLKRLYIRFYAKNTDMWMVQTQNTENLVREYLPINGKQVIQFPFYKIDDGLKAEANQERLDYVFIGEYTSAKGHEDLVEAWYKLTNMGFGKTLHMTVSNPDFLDALNASISKGNSIDNHGFISHKDVISIYKRSKAIIYPSLNESLGLGIIEAIEAGCDVIGADLPYLHSVCIPSETFEPHNSDSIVEAVLRYENNQHRRTVLTIHDMADELIDYLLK